jgi:hypothetical protein
LVSEAPEVSPSPQNGCVERRLFLDPGERVQDRICLDAVDYILTNRQLHLIPHSDGTDDDSLSVGLYQTRANIERILENTLIDWTATDDMVFLFAGDHRITVIGHEGGSVRLDTIRIDGNITGASIFYHSGFLFVAPVSNHIMAFNFFEEYAGRSIPLPEQLHDLSLREFIPTDDGRLFFGRREGKQVEIRAEDCSINAITLEIR